MILIVISAVAEKLIRIPLLNRKEEVLLLIRKLAFHPRLQNLLELVAERVVRTVRV